MIVELDLQNATTFAVPESARFNAWVTQALRPFTEQAVLTLRLVESAEMQQLNQQFRAQDRATNVLAFASQMPEPFKAHFLGDILICAEVVEQQAKEQHKAVLAHWAHLTVHGTLHLLGFDHITPEQAKIMERHEQHILAQLGFPNPYLEVDNEG
jgi:probable rRNA maturation factor